MQLWEAEREGGLAGVPRAAWAQCKNYTSMEPNQGIAITQCYRLVRLYPLPVILKIRKQNASNLHLFPSSGEGERHQIWPMSSQSQNQSYNTTDGQSTSALVAGTLLEPETRVFSLSICLDSYGIVDVGRPLWRGVGYVVYRCCWASPAQSFSSLSLARFMTTCYCLNFLDSHNPIGLKGLLQG
jgi:hypothetical protein